jgi:hypothetical protein
METKVCVDCKLNKPRSDFYPKRKSGNSLQSRCVLCMSEYKKKRYYANRESELEKTAKRRNKPEYVEKRKEYYEKNKEKYKERYLGYISDEEKRLHKNKINRERYHKKKAEMSEKKKAYRRTEAFKERSKIKHKERKSNDINYVLKRRLRFRLRHAVTAIQNGKFKRKSALDLLGCDLLFFKQYLESQFKDGMSWDRISEVHLDHKIPCSSFDLTKEEEQKKCFHYTNIQPLWALDNLRKGVSLNFKNK